MSRRKGEQPVTRTWPAWSPDHPVAQIMAGGDDWFFAWALQSNMTDVQIARASGIGTQRLNDLYFGAPVTREEIDRVALAWQTDPGDIVASLPEGRLVVLGSPHDALGSPAHTAE